MCASGLRRSRGWLLAWAAASVAAFYTHYLSVLVIAGQVLVASWLQWRGPSLARSDLRQLARFALGALFVCLPGLWLLAHLYLRRFTYKATIALLLLLSLYLGGMILVQGNTGNCGCFGEWLYMKPADAIWKNVAMILGVMILYLIYPSRPYRKQGYVAAFLADYVSQGEEGNQDDQRE